MHLAFTACNLLAWARRITLHGPLRRATPKTLRHRLLHVAAHISPHRLRLDRHWPWTTTLTAAIEQARTRLRPPNVTIAPAIHPGL